MAHPTQCPICGQSASAPYRRTIGGKITEGCVASFHDGQLVVPSASADWHRRGRKAGLGR